MFSGKCFSIFLLSFCTLYVCVLLDIYSTFLHLYLKWLARGSADVASICLLAVLCKTNQYTCWRCIHLLCCAQFQYKDRQSMQQCVINEMKVFLKPYYTRRRITKEQYKEIMRSAVTRVYFNGHLICVVCLIILSC